MTVQSGSPRAAGATTVSRPPLALGDLAQRPMPVGVRGALVRAVPQLITAPIPASWVPAQDPAPIRPGAVVLRWLPVRPGSMNVTAHLGLASSEVLLATWPNLQGDWTSIVHPTLREVTGLHAALSVAIDALHLANQLSEI